MNKEVLRRMGFSCEIVNTIKHKKLEYLGHIMRGPLLQLIVQGKISGKISIGRRRVSWLKNLRVEMHQIRNHDKGIHGKGTIKEFLSPSSFILILF